MRFLAVVFLATAVTHAQALLIVRRPFRIVAIAVILLVVAIRFLGPRNRG
jgi:hypothetical protein